MQAKRYARPVLCAMKRSRPKTRTLGMVVLICAVAVCSADAVPLGVSVATDKTAYVPGELLTVLVTAHNPNDYDVLLSFGSSLQAQYVMDDSYTYPTWALDVLTELWIPASSSHTWSVHHPWSEYDLSLGSHSVLGNVINVGYSQPYLFEVIPEPATLLLLSLGGLAVVRRRR